MFVYNFFLFLHYIKPSTIYTILLVQSFENNLSRLSQEEIVALFLFVPYYHLTTNLEFCGSEF
jgi:hypothetical protein